MYNFGHFGTKQAGELLGSIGSLFTTSELCLGLAVNQQSIGIANKQNPQFLALHSLDPCSTLKPGILGAF